jgi:hypothetical protein
MHKKLGLAHNKEVAHCMAAMLLLAGHAKTIEFAFDSVQDTPECIASEMMEDLSLSATEAQLIAAQITQELAR